MNDEELYRLKEDCDDEKSSINKDLRNTICSQHIENAFLCHEPLNDNKLVLNTVFII